MHAASHTCGAAPYACPSSGLGRPGTVATPRRCVYGRIGHANVALYTAPKERKEAAQKKAEGRFSKVRAGRPRWRFSARALGLCGPGRSVAITQSSRHSDLMWRSRGVRERASLRPRLSPQALDEYRAVLDSETRNVWAANGCGAALAELGYLESAQVRFTKGGTADCHENGTRVVRRVCLCIPGHPLIVPCL
jgi:hypothetical protein